MPALYTITTRASGTILTAAIYNADHQNHVNNGDAPHLGGFSASVSQMKQQVSPGDVGSESLSLSIADELARIRYMIALQRGTTFWYGTSRSSSDGMNYLRNSNFLVASRMGQANQSYAASSGAPYTFDQWYMSNGVNQAAVVWYGGGLYNEDLSSAEIQRSPGQTGTTQMWFSQPFTLAQLAPLRGKQVTVSISFLTGANFSSTNLNLQINTGTGLAGKFVSGFTGTVLVANVGISTSPSMPLTRIQATGIVPANATQMDTSLVWTPVGTAGATDGIWFAQAKLELGSIATPYIPPDPYAELIELQTFYYKTFQLGVLPQQNAGISGAIQMTQASTPSAINSGNGIRWARRMCAAPTITLFNPVAANAQARNLNTAADCSATSAQFADESGCSIQYTAAAASGSGNVNAVHLTAEAGI